MKKLLTPMMASLLTLTACQNLPSTTTTTQTTSTTTPQQNNLHNYTLDNGLQVIIKEDKRSPIVMTQIWYKVGSVDEPAGIGGISHFLEHLMFKDTPLLTGNQYHRVISHFGGSKNAFTSYDYTAYFESLPANQYPLALQIEANRMNNLLFDTAQIETERQVVKEERRLRTDDNPIALAFENFNMTAMSQSPRGLPVIGSMNDIDAITQADLQSWYQHWYRPNNAVLVVVGDINANDVKPWVERYFGKIRPADTPKRPKLTQPSHQGYRQITSSQAVQVPMIIMGFNIPTISSQAQDDAYALSLLADIADGGLSARFERHLIRQKGLFDSISASSQLLQRGDGLFLVVATPKAGVSLADAEQAILDELDAISTGQINDDEIARSQTNLTAELIFANDSIAEQAQTLGMLASLGLPLDTLDNLPKRLASIHKDDVQKAGRHYLNKDNLTTMYIIPKQQN